MRNLPKRIFTFTLLGFVAVGLAACGDAVNVENGQVAKIKTAEGLREDLIPPSGFRLDHCWREPCDKLIVLEDVDYELKESLDFVVPADQMKLAVDIRGRLKYRDDDAKKFVFGRAGSEPVTGQSRVRIIKMEKIYAKYAQNVIRTTVRSKMSERNIATNMANRDNLGTELFQVLNEALANTPFVLTQIGVAKMDPPKVILDAEIKAKEREIAIKEAQANKLIDLEKADARAEVARKDQVADLIEAETQVKVNQKLAEGVSEAWALQRGLKILEKLADGDNKVILMPTEALTNPAIMMGVGNQAIGTDLGKPKQ